MHGKPGRLCLAVAVAAAVMGGVASGEPIPEDARPGAAAEADDIDAIVRKIRKEYPQYADWSDAELRAALSAKFNAEQARASQAKRMRLRLGSVADRIRATGFAVGDGDRPPLSDEDIVARVESIDRYIALSVIDILCSMAAEVEYGILELSGATRGKGRGAGNILAGEPDKNVYVTTLKAAKLSRNLRKEAEERGGSCDAAHSAAGRINLR